ncbi:MAG: VOC family protein [Bacteroidota bacterium]|nr:VOC family protein [Bacteroidota bacterium]
MKKTAILIVSLLLFGVVHAQDTATSSLTFNHLAISVKDVNVAAEFYHKVLNLKEIENRAKLEGVRWFSTGDGYELHLISVIKEPIVLNKALHIAFATSNFDALVSTLNEMKIIYSDWPGNLNKVNMRADGVKQVFFQDPDGYWIEVNSVGK